MGNSQQKPALGEAAEETCLICMERIPSPEMKFNTSSCIIHTFCNDCMSNYIQSRLTRNSPYIACPALDCLHRLEPLSCRPQISTQLFDEWCDVLCRATVSELEHVHCPYQDCCALVVNECGDINVKRCVCPNCKKPFCFWCRIPWSWRHRCMEFMDKEKMFLKVAERKKWKRCPACGHCIERVSGCSTITCRCGTEFCYDSRGRSMGVICYDFVRQEAVYIQSAILRLVAGCFGIHC